MKEIRGTYKDRIYGKDVYVLEDSIMESMKDFVKDRRYVREVLDVRKREDREKLKEKTDINYSTIGYVKRDDYLNLNAKGYLNGGNNLNRGNYLNILDYLNANGYLNGDNYLDVSNNVAFNNNSQPRVAILTGINTNKERAKEIGVFTRKLLKEDIRLIQNKTHPLDIGGYIQQYLPTSITNIKTVSKILSKSKIPGFWDVKEYKSNKLFVGDFVTAYELQQLPDNSAVMGHSGGSGDILDAMVVSAIQGGRINANIILLGSPEKKEDFIRVGKDVGVKSVNMINHPKDPVPNPLPALSEAIDIAINDMAKGANKGKVIGGAIGKVTGWTIDKITGANRGKIAGENIGNVIGGTIGGINSIVPGVKDGWGSIEFKLKEYHTFESYFNNPEFKLQQLIQNLLMQDVIKSIEEKGLSSEKE